MDLTPGTRLGPYEIVSRIGAGGMGEVFRARDTRLDRSVAIKVLPAEFARNAQLKVRFEREARAISQLNHPNICTLYDVGDDYLVMELLEGESLAERLARGPLALGEVVRYGSQIAEALDRAHRAGIVHRDLKPGNIMITKAGAKLLDFGLAKSSGATTHPDEVTLQHDQSLTQEGTILGTFQYMAPEQLEAEEADARTDIFALGAVLYEMATGRRAFQGKTKTSLIAAIVGGQPQPVSQLIPLSPPALDHLILKCLEKERDDRWQNAHDVAEELKWIGTIPAEASLRTARATKIGIVAATILAIALAAMTAMWFRAKSAPQKRMAFAIVPPKGYAFENRLLSPDGASIAFSASSMKSEGGLWVRPVDAIEPKRLTSGLYDYPLAWSADSKWLVYLSDPHPNRMLKRIEVATGTAEVMSRHLDRIHTAAWAADGTIVYNPFFGAAIHAWRADAPEPRRLTTIDRSRKESFHGWPAMLADGQRFLYVVHTIAEQQNEIWAGSLDGKLKKMITRADSLVGVARSHLYFVRDGAIVAQRFDEDALELSGEPRRAADRVEFSEAGITAGAMVGRNGALLYKPLTETTSELGWYDRAGRRIEKIREDVNWDPQALSRDGSRLLTLKFNAAKGAPDIYVVDLIRNTETRLTSGLATYSAAMWSPDGNKVYFTSDREGAYDIYVQAEDGSTPAEAVWQSDLDKNTLDVSPSGDALLVGTVGDKTRADVWIVPTAAPKTRRPLLATDFNEDAARFSPDGRWVAWTSDRSGVPELYMRPLEGGRATQISTGGANGYLFSPDGSEVYVRTPRNDRVAIPLRYEGNTVIPGKPAFLFTPPTLYHSIVAVTEKGFLMSTVPDPSAYVPVLHYDSRPLP